MIRAFGGKLSSDPAKLFSTPSDKGPSGGAAASAARPVADESDLEAMRRRLGEGGDADSVAPSGGGLELTEVLKEKTQALKQAFGIAKGLLPRSGLANSESRYDRCDARSRVL